jgi:hypothetical protein
MQVTVTLVGDLEFVTKFLTGRDTIVDTTQSAERVNGATVKETATEETPEEKPRRGRKPKAAAEVKEATPEPVETESEDSDPLGLGDDLADDEQVPSFETVRSQFSVFASRHGRAKAIELLHKYKAQKIGDLDPKNYSAFYSACVNTK